mgnify:CR=1 FL=1
MRAFFSILWKDLLIEFRTKDIIYPMALFSLVLLVIFSFAFLQDPKKAIDYGPGIVWVCVLFSSTVGQNRLFDKERENNCLSALLLCPCKPYTIFLAKVMMHLILASLVQLFSIPLILVFFDLSLVDSLSFVASLVLGNIGLAIIGTLFASMLTNSKMKEVLLPLVTYPLVIPLLVAGVKVSAIALGAPIFEDVNPWLRFMLGFDLFAGLLAFLLFERMIRQ